MSNEAPPYEQTRVDKENGLTSTDVAPVSKGALVRFIDGVEAFFLRVAPVAKTVETLAVAAEPVLALTPAGPEYQVAVNAIVSAQQVAQASLAAGTALTGTQKAAIAVQAATPALATILSSKGVSTDTENVIQTWIQNVFNILAGPVATLVAAKTATVSQSSGK